MKTALLQDLAASGVRFVLYGGAGFALRYGLDYEPPDVDVLLVAGELAAFVQWALPRGRVECWGEPWRPEWTEASLQERLYVRAWPDGVQLDATFVTPHVDVEALWRRAARVHGVPLCPDEELWAAKRRKDPAALDAFARRFGLTPPEGAARFGTR